MQPAWVLSLTRGKVCGAGAKSLKTLGNCENILIQVDHVNRPHSFRQTSLAVGQTESLNACGVSVRPHLEARNNEARIPRL